MGSTDGASEAAATKGYYEAAAAGADRIDSGPIQVDNLTQKMKDFAREDPNRRMKLALAAKVAEHVRRSMEDAKHAQVVDIGCGIGTDIGMMLAELPECAGMKGVDLMDVVLEQARADYPAPTMFLKGDIHDMSFLGNDSQDVVRCSRLLIHAADMRKALDEMIRILRPGGLAVIVEGDYTQARLESEDAVVQKVFEAQTAATMAFLKNPATAGDVHEYLKGHAAVQGLAIESDTELVAGGPMVEHQLAGLAKLLAGKVEAGAVAQSELDHYSKALLAGDAKLPCTLFTVSFTKKHAQ